MNELTISTEARPTPSDPLRMLAAALILQALEDATRANQDIGLEARRFLFGKGEEYRRNREHWLRMAGLPFDCLERFKTIDAQALRARLHRRSIPQRREQQRR